MFMIADIYAICDKYIAVASYCTVQYSWMLLLAGHEHTSITLYVARGGLRYNFIPSYGGSEHDICIAFAVFKVYLHQCFDIDI
jgi:hypothetical protein